MILTTEEVLSLAAGELLAIRRKSEPIRLTCRPKLADAPPQAELVKAGREPEPVMLSQTSELLRWLDQIMPPTSLSPTPKQGDRS